ncbi:hypothetical protein HYE67_000001 [Fusarium culmorum]|uniref:Uncharacterized protein n=1 Tax=Fusarium culmorum TaxID=5516 RepID=A0A7S8CWU9_FUSCU|nr:hypothetical protein HYE67_000001 [Fusarium culmorum]
MEDIAKVALGALNFTLGEKGPNPPEAQDAIEGSEASAALSEALEAIEVLSQASEAPTTASSQGEIEVQSLSVEHPSEAPSEAIEPSIPREKAPEATEGPIGGRSPLEAQHQQAIAPIVEKGSIKKLLTFSKVPIPEKKLYARHARAFAIAASKAAEAFCKKPTEKALLSFLLLPRVLGLGLQKGGLAALLRNYPANIPTLEDLETFLGQQKPPTLQKNPPKIPSEVPKEPNQALIALPTREGGLGIPLHKELAPQLYQAAIRASQPTLAKIRAAATGDPPPIAPIAIEGPTAKEVLIEANKARLETFLQDLPTLYQQARLENASYLGRKWLGVLPTKKTLSFADSEITEALRSRLFYPVKPPSLPCSSCGAIVAFQHEDTCKGAARRWIARHDTVVRAFYRALASEPTLEVQKEPLVDKATSLRADIAVTIGNSRYFYDIQIVAIAKDSARSDPYETLREAAEEKRRKYRALGAFFQPIIISSGGLMELETAKTYRKLQDLVGPVAAAQLDSSIALALTRTRAISAASISKEAPRGIASSLWNPSRRDP